MCVCVCDGVWGFSLLWELIHGIGFWFAFLVDGIIRFVCVVVFFFSLCGVSIPWCAFFGSLFLFEFWGGCVCVCVCDMGNPSVVGVSIIWVVAFSDVLW
jgi:hypothetical protein